MNMDVLIFAITLLGYNNNNRLTVNSQEQSYFFWKSLAETPSLANASANAVLIGCLEFD